MRSRFIALALFTLISLRVSAQDLTAEAVANDVNVRSDSTVMSHSLCTLPKGTRIYIIEDKFDWYKVRLPQSFKAYVATKYIDIIGPKKGKINATTLNLRTDPSTDAYVVGKAQANDVVQIVAKEGEWYKISVYPYGTGWVNKKFLKIHKTAPEIENLVNQLSVNDQKIRESAKSQLIAKGQQIVSDIELYLNKDTDKPTAYGIIAVLGELMKNNKDGVKELLKMTDNADTLTAAMCLDIAQNAVSPKTKMAYYYYATQNKLDYQTLQTAKGYLSRVNSCSTTIIK